MLNIWIVKIEYLIFLLFEPIYCGAYWILKLLILFSHFFKTWICWSFQQTIFALFRSLSEDKNISVSEVSVSPLSLRLLPAFWDVMFDMEPV